jgi:hypothetical protein
MDTIAVAKLVKKWRIPYSSPAKFGSVVCYRVWCNDECVYDGVDVGKQRLTKQQVLTWVKKRFNVVIDPKEVKDHGVVRV